MGEYEPRDSRIVTQNPSATPIEPERTGPKEGGTRTPVKDDVPRQTEPAEGPREADDEDRWQVSETNRCWPEAKEGERGQ